MSDFEMIGKSIPKKESYDKVTGAAKYTGDSIIAGILHAKMATSPYAHAGIRSIDTSEAWNVFGVRAVLTGEDCPVLTGETIRDRPIIAIDKVRYYGETVAVVVAESEYSAKRAAGLIRVEYEPLPVVNSPSEAIKDGAPLIHEESGTYERLTSQVYPEPGTNIANVTKIRKGNMQKGWMESEVVAEETVSFAPSDHAALETRCAVAEIRPDGRIMIDTSSQAPFAIPKYMGIYFNIEPGLINVNTPLVGGGYGGKASIQLELIAYLASKAVGGKKVKILNTRKEDLITSPAHIGMEAKVKLGCTRDGRLKAAELLYWFDGGAYSDKAVDISLSAATGCTGPYNIEHVYCDSLCLYTNHPYAGAWRGYGFSELTFAVERAMDRLAEKLNFDPLELRRLNAIKPGDTTPTQALLNRSTVGDLSQCIERLKALINWDEGQCIDVSEDKIRAKGISCFWKNSSFDADASSGAILTFNRDGSINLDCGVVEIGTGTKTVLAQILAERMKMDTEKIHVKFEVNTQTSPEHWKTVGSRGTWLAGRAVLRAAEDAIRQLKEVASAVLRVSPDDLEVSRGEVFVRGNPHIQIDIKEICYGYVYPNGNAIGGQIIGRGNYIQPNMRNLHPETGEGKLGPEWAVGAQGVEVEFNTRTYTYKLIKAVTVMDAGRVLNRKGAEGQVMGAMNMGLGFANRERFIFNDQGIIQNGSLRNYHLMRYGENPEYIVEFIETPFADGPYGARGIGEHGVLGMPAALAGSLSRASGVHLNQLPLIPEYIWRMKTRRKNGDPI